ncbi:hypothetical protein COOONC_02302 [Cooperia oncophora]
MSGSISILAICVHTSIYRVFEYNMRGKSLTLYRLAVHLFFEPIISKLGTTYLERPSNPIQPVSTEPLLPSVARALHPTLDRDGHRGKVDKKQLGGLFTCEQSTAESTSRSLMQRKLLGYLDDDRYFRKSLLEKVRYQSASTMRSFFACLLCFCKVLQAHDL